MSHLVNVNYNTTGDVVIDEQDEHML